MNNPEILFMDEPTKSLDPNAAQNLRAFIKKHLVKGQGKTVFLSTHHLGEAEQLCYRIAIMDNARIRACGTLSELRKIIEGEETYILEVKELSKDVLNKLADLKGVIDFSAHVHSDIVSIEIRLSKGETILPQIIDMIVNAGGKIRACTTKKCSKCRFRTNNRWRNED